MKQKPGITQAFKRTAFSFVGMFPILLGVLALASIVSAAVSPQMIAGYLSMEGALGPLVGAAVGSVAAGHPVTSYVLGGELLAAGVGLATIAAFLVSWVTVGVIQLPAEIIFLGRRFALYRSLFCFLSSIAVAFLTVFTLKLLGL